MIVVGFDVGPTNTSLAVIEWASNRARWIRGGAVEPSLSVKEWVLTIEQWSPRLVAVEWPEQGKHQAMGNILEARTIATTIQNSAAFAGVDCVTFPAAEWRKNVLGRTKRVGATTIDAICLRIVPRLITEMPARLTNHDRDAAGVALFAARNHRLLLAQQKRRAG